VIDVFEAPGDPVLPVTDAAVLEDEIGDPRTSPIRSTVLKTETGGMGTLNSRVFVTSRKWR